ncbi:hypothetical protein GCM10011340_24580 [Roseivirga thermotolerans]|uniref:Uncharacterized protein n=2 Tax=Roseivirgaceae TaxID=2762306 RepID=A0ABQ3I693_9BACT|nr:hypothetical protein GCM10011340_24580 [Roseivirga thermotolerans]
MTKRRLHLYLNMASNTIQTKVNTEGIYKDTARQLLIADMLTFGKYLLNLIFIALFFILVLEAKSLLQIDIFPNYNFPLDEMVKDFF